MQFIRPPISTLCIGQAASMGSLLLAAGQRGKRFALPNSRSMVLADNVIIENRANIYGSGNAITRLDKRALVLLADDVHAQFNAFIADEHRRPGNQFPDFVLTLPAEGTIECVF